MDSVSKDLHLIFVYLDDLTASTCPTSRLFPRGSNLLKEEGCILPTSSATESIRTVRFHSCQWWVPSEPPHSRSLSGPYRSSPVCDFYCRFNLQAAPQMCPLYEALKGKAPKHTLDWPTERDKAFVKGFLRISIRFTI